MLLVLLIPSSPFLSGCTGQNAEELYEIAQLEERQNNQAHARELYEQILREFPDSAVADRARDRLQALGPATDGRTTAPPEPRTP